MPCPAARLALAFFAVAALGAAQESRPVATPRFDTSRPNPKLLPLPKEEGVFHFVVFGDRTGGPKDGVKVLAQSVADTNLLAPDLVMTVGDLIQGYTVDAEWKTQAEEYSGIMNGLKCPWYPVPGNHDTYYSGPDKARLGHDANFEAHFGPLWYAVEHKNCWFVALYSDEGDPETGRKAFSDPKSQRMSDAQFAWLRGVLARAKGADHVFLFLHHPRWLKVHESARYGDDWDRVHDLLKSAGNVSAVFAGHIHRMRYDGKRDGIEYFTLATVGGRLATDAPTAGYLHHFNVVTVRKGRIDVAAIPVGATLDPRAMAGETSRDVAALADKFAPRELARPAFAPGAAFAETYEIELKNPASRPIEVSALFDARDPTFVAEPDHRHVVVPAGETRRAAFLVHRAARPLDPWFTPPTFEIRTDLLAENARVQMPPRLLPMELDMDLATALPADTKNGVLKVDGDGAAVRVDLSRVALPDGPFTVEGRLRAAALKGRRGFVNNTESSGFGLFVGDGKPGFTVFLGSAYVGAQADKVVLRENAWHHVAGVYDGAEVRLYVDGKLVASKAGTGVRKTNGLPLYVGADVDANGKPVSYFDGEIDDVRISRGARYSGSAFDVPARFEPDAETLLLLRFDGLVGPFAPDLSTRHAHGLLIERAAIGPPTP
jgi:hypothetical protein